MNWIFKVIFIVVYQTSNSRCRPPLYNQVNYPDLKQKEYISAGNLDLSYELSKNVRSILNDKWRSGPLPLRLSGDRQEDPSNESTDPVGRVTPEGSYNKDEMKRRRGVDVGILVNYPTTQSSDSKAMEKLQDILAKALANRLVEGDYVNTSGCPSCDEEVVVKRVLKPAFVCDEWDPKHRVCVVERNIGDTVTFYLSTGKDEGVQQPNVTWKKEFHMRDSKERKVFDIDSQNPPENIIIGKKGYELRISPITETDMAYNMFSATLQTHPSFRSKLFFMIRIVPVDLGFVYVGETIELNLRKFVSLPERSLSFKWYMEKDGEHGTLPSNMKVSITGSSIKISELRREQEGILACSVYTNLHVLATKKRFLIKDLSKNKDVLQSSPNHSLVFKEIVRNKRDPKTYSPVFPSSLLSRHKRARTAIEDVERALLQHTPTEKEIPSYTTKPSRYNTEPEVFDDNENKFQEISDYAENVPETNQIYEGNRIKTAYKELNDGQRNLKLPGQMNEELSLQSGIPPDELNNADSGLIQPKNRQYSSNRMPLEDVPDGIQNGAQQIDVEVQTKKDKIKQQYDDSDVVLNIDRIKGSRKTSAEEQIAKLISYCYNDFECSVTATCVRPNLKKPGFCKCLHGASGVGIFCREEIWLSNSNFDMSQHNFDYMAYQEPAYNDRKRDLFKIN